MTYTAHNPFTGKNAEFETALEALQWCDSINDKNCIYQHNGKWFNVNGEPSCVEGATYVVAPLS